MKANANFSATTKAQIAVAILCAMPLLAQDLDESYKNSILYYSKFRGAVIEDMYIDKSAIVALQKDGVLPSGARIVVEEYFNENGKKGALNRYIEMKKRGVDWDFMPYNADKSLNTNDNPTRCKECHTSAIRGEDKVFSLDKIKAFRFK